MSNNALAKPYPISTPERDSLESDVIDIVKQLSPDDLDVLRILGQRHIAARRYKRNVLGRTFHRLTAIDVADPASDSAERWRFMCECGRKKTIRAENVRRGLTRSCGCFRNERITETIGTHGHAALSVRGGKISPTYSTWRSMLNRCERPAEQSYENYGGRGISVCEKWHLFENFLADMGNRPAGTTIDRIDVNGNYEPGNCRWATQTEQVRNRRTTKLEPHEPEQIRWLSSLGYKQREIAKHFDISQRLVLFIVKGQVWK